MARPTRAMPFRNRRQITAQDTFDFTTPDLGVTARPVDAFAQPQPSSGVQNLIESLSSVNRALSAYGGRLQQQYKEDLQKGQLLRAQGAEKPTQGEALIKGWEQLDGELAARRDFKNEVFEFANSNLDLDPEEFQAGLDEISAKYLSAATEDYAKGFVPVALELEQRALDNYTKAQQERVQVEGRRKISELSSDVTVDVLQSTILPLFSDLEDIEDIAGNANVYSVIEASDIEKSWSNILHTQMEDLKKRAADLNISKAEVEALFLDQVAQEAVRLGLPELLDFAYKKNQSGFSIAGSELGGRLESYVAQAKSRRDSLTAARDARISKENAERQNMKVNDVRLAASQARLIEDPIERANAKQELLNSLLEDEDLHSLPQSTFNSLLTDINSIGDVTDYPEEGNEERYVDLFADALSNSLTIEEINQAVADNDLTMEQHMSLLREYSNMQERLESELAEWDDKALIEDLKAQALNAVAGVEQFRDPFQNSTALRLTNMWANGLKTFREEHGGRNPNLNEFTENILKPSLINAGFSLEEVMRGGSGEIEEFQVAEDPGLKSAFTQIAAGIQERIEDPTTPKLSGIFKSIATIMDRNLEGVVSKDVDTLRGFLGKTQELADTARSLTDDQAHELLSIAFFNEEAPLTKGQLETILIEENGESPEAVEYYMDTFALNFAKSAFESPEFPDRLAATRHIRDSLLSAGFDPDYINSVIYTVSQPEDGSESSGELEIGLDEIQ